MTGVSVHNGLRRISHDTRYDFNHKRFWPIKRQLFGATNILPGLPTTLGRIPVCINDQGISDYCTAFAVSEAIGNQTGVPMAPEAQTAIEGKIDGAPIFGGTSPHTALTGGVTAAVPKTLCFFTFQQNGWQLPAEWGQYPTDPSVLGASNKRSSYYSVTFGGPDDMSAFDSIKLALWDAKNDVPPNMPNAFTSVVAFGFWYAEWNGAGSDGIAPQQVTPAITRHAYLFIDWITINGVDYLIAQLSQGTGFGKGGLVLFTRAEVNAAWSNPVQNGIGMYIFRSKDPNFWTSLTFNILSIFNLN